MELAMQLNHLDLSVSDVAATAAFFVHCFGFRIIEERGNNGMAILRGENSFILVLTRCLEPQYPKSFHIGFLLPSEQAVVQAYDHVRAAGFDVPKPPAEMRGALLFYCHTPDGILVEIAHRAQPVP
jgi:lactoylglutathione lyase